MPLSESVLKWKDIPWLEFACITTISANKHGENIHDKNRVCVDIVLLLYIYIYKSEVDIVLFKLKKLTMIYYVYQCVFFSRARCFG